MPDLPRLHGTEMVHFPSGSLPFIQVAVPYLVVILICRIWKDELPIQIFLHSLHEIVANANRQVRVRHLAHRLLHRNEIKYIRMPIVNHQHQRTATAAALLDQAGRIAEQPAPGYGAAG
ncbi:hypothetical protein D3C77_499450 [compost metagenome]